MLRPNIAGVDFSPLYQQTALPYVIPSVGVAARYLKTSTDFFTTKRGLREVHSDSWLVQNAKSGLVLMQPRGTPPQPLVPFSEKGYPAAPALAALEGT